MSEWQPIETAPRETPILAVNAAGVMLVVSRDLRFDTWSPEGVSGYDYEIDFWGGDANKPTHWMPLPSPPAMTNDRARKRKDDPNA